MCPEPLPVIPTFRNFLCHTEDQVVILVLVPPDGIFPPPDTYTTLCSHKLRAAWHWNKCKYACHLWFSSICDVLHSGSWKWNYVTSLHRQGSERQNVTLSRLQYKRKNQMETKLKPLLNPKPPLRSHFTIYRWYILQVSCHVLGLIICAAPLAPWQGTFIYVVLIIPNKF